MADLVHSPLFGLLLTLASYRLATWLYGKVHSLPLFHPFIVASIPVIVVLPLVGVSYTEYRDQTQVLSFLLGPATVALAWPLYRQLHTVRSVWRPILITTFIGAALAAGISIYLAWLLGAPEAVVGSLAPKSITTPIAVEVVKSTDPLSGRAGPSPGNLELLRKLLEECVGLVAPGREQEEPAVRYLAFFREVVQSTARLVAPCTAGGLCGTAGPALC